MRRKLHFLLLSNGVLVLMMMVKWNHSRETTIPSKDLVNEAPGISMPTWSTETHRYFQPIRFTQIPRHVCSPEIETLFVVHSSIINQGQRAAIRATYANQFWQKLLNYRTIFAVGRSNEEEDEKRLKEEADLYGDILQADYIDAYRNLTIKMINWMRYVYDYCPEVTMIVKLDDDILPNVIWLSSDLQSGKVSKTNTFTCAEIYGPVIRDKGSPWYVSKTARPKDEWETYCSGPAFVMKLLELVPRLSADLCPRLVERVEKHRHYNPVDDAFITGDIAKEIGAEHNFKMYGSRCFWSGNTDKLILSGQAIFAAYGSTTTMKRIFHELSILTGIVTDPPDYFPRSNKAGPINEEE